MKPNFNNADFYELKDNSEKMFFNTDEAIKAGYDLKDLIGVHSHVLIDEVNGIHIPQLFIKNFNFDFWGLKKKDYMALYHPESESYWFAWENLLREAKKIDTDEVTWLLHQDGSLFTQAQIEFEKE